MSKYVLGLDIGTNSIGWVLFKENKIFDKSVVIFPIGTNVNKMVINQLRTWKEGATEGQGELFSVTKVEEMY